MDSTEYASQIIAKHGASLDSGKILDIATRMIVEERGTDSVWFFHVPINCWNLLEAYRAQGGYCSNW